MLISFRVMIVICTLLTISAAAEQKDLLIKDKKIIYKAYDLQDRYDACANTSLKGFKTFVLFVNLGNINKTFSDKINQLIQKNVRKYGTVNVMSLLTEQKAIDLSGFDSGATLTYAIRNLRSPDEKPLGIIRASLNLSTSATITKTKETSFFYVWSTNCFLPGSIEKDTEKVVLESLDTLFKIFQTCYFSVNSEKPIFNLYLQ